MGQFFRERGMAVKEDRDRLEPPDHETRDEGLVVVRVDDVDPVSQDDLIKPDRQHEIEEGFLQGRSGAELPVGGDIGDSVDREVKADVRLGVMIGYDPHIVADPRERLRDGPDQDLGPL